MLRCICLSSDTTCKSATLSLSNFNEDGRELVREPSGGVVQLVERVLIVGAFTDSTGGS